MDTSLMSIRNFRVALADGLAALATQRRESWARAVAKWEAETEPGYPLPGFRKDGRALALAVADLQDAFADSIRPQPRNA